MTNKEAEGGGGGPYNYLNQSGNSTSEVSEETKISYDIDLSQDDIALLAVQLGLNTRGNLVKAINKIMNPVGKYDN